MDWVKARAACSLKGVFQLLSEVVDSDVKAANALDRKDIKFTLNRGITGKLIVVRERDLGGFGESAGIVFELLPSKITIAGAGLGDKPLHTMTPYLNEEGECLLEVEGRPQPLRLWQVSRIALDDLFFGF